jgi:hypothetical protein
MMNKTVEYFARLLMQEVRDRAIEGCEAVVQGKRSGPLSGPTYERVKKLSPADRDVVLTLIPFVVDATLHELLSTLEADENLTLLIRTEGDPTPRNLVEECIESLYGSLWDWIEKFSKKPHYDW